MLDGVGAARRIVAMARQGLGVMRSPLGATLAILFQIAGWVCQLLAVWTAMRAFDIHAPLPAAGVVLLLMNVATIFPLWPGNVGLVQVAIATPLAASYGVAYAHGVAYGFGLQAIEASVGIGVGAAVPRARGAVVRDAARDAVRGAGGDVGRRTTRRARPMPAAARARVPG